MPIDHSIYSKMKAINVGDIVEKGMHMRDLAGQRKREEAADAREQERHTVDMRKAFRNETAENLQLQRQKLETTSQLLGSIPRGPNYTPEQKQKAYESAMGKAIQLGLADRDELPPQFDEGFINNLEYRTLTTKERFDLQWKEKEFGLKERETKAKEIEAGAKGRETSSKAASDLRKERSGLPTTRDTQAVAAAYNRVQAAAKTPSAAGDLALIFNYMKMLDPGSTVREGEFANAENSGGIPDRVAAQYNKMLRGERLTADQRADFIGQAGGQYQSQIDLQNRIDAQYSSLAERAGASPQDVILDFQSNQPAAPKAPGQAGASGQWGGGLNEANAGQELKFRGKTNELDWAD